jgi:hypothetical protein
VRLNPAVPAGRKKKRNTSSWSAGRCSLPVVYGDLGFWYMARVGGPDNEVEPMGNHPGVWICGVHRSFHRV